MKKAAVVEPLSAIEREELARHVRAWEGEYSRLLADPLQLDLTRGKPSAQQLDECSGLDGALQGDYLSADGRDTRNYGDARGLPEARALCGELFGFPPQQVAVAGSSSLQLVYLAGLFARDHGFAGPGSAWSQLGEPAKILCPAPGYDRHFSICEHLGLQMVPIVIGSDGPDMDAIERAVAEDPSVRGVVCVPRFSNPTGCVYSDETVRRFARLGRAAAPGFLIFWDNAYALHAFSDHSARLMSLREACEAAGTEDSFFEFGSTSKITFAGSGLAFVMGSQGNVDDFVRHFGVTAICPDQVNQLRHVRFWGGPDGVRQLMRRHAQTLAAKFSAVESALSEGLARRQGMPAWGSWSTPQGGYFVSFDTQPGLAGQVIAMAARAGVKLTPAGSTFPYGRDPNDANIRIAPTCLDEADLRRAMAVFVLCVQLATAKRCLP